MLYSLIYAWPFVVFVVDEILSDLSCDFSCERFRGGIISKECGSKLDQGVLLVGYGQSGGGDVINEWVHFSMEVMDTICAPENWMVSTPFPPFPIKDPISKPWWMQVLHLLGRSSLLDHQELLGPSMGRRRCLATKESAPGGCVIEHGQHK